MKVIIPCHRRTSSDIFYLAKSLELFDPGLAAEYVFIFDRQEDIAANVSSLTSMSRTAAATILRLKDLPEEIAAADSAVFSHLVSLYDEFVLLWPENLIVGQDAWLRRIVEARNHGKQRLPVYALVTDGMWSRNGWYSGRTLRQWPLARHMAGRDGSALPFNEALAACFLAERRERDPAAVLPEAEAFEEILCAPPASRRQAVARHYQRHALLSGPALPFVRDAILREKAESAAPAVGRSLPLGRPASGRKSAGDALLGRNKAVPLADWQDAFTGRRCFLICNGPSLRRTNLAALRHEYTFGLNRIYLNYERMGFQPTFYACVNPNIARQFGYDLNQLRSVRFFEANFAPYIRNSWNAYFLQHNGAKEANFSRDLRPLSWHHGWTVTFCAMQAAYYLGFREVILVGCDHYFSVSGEANKTVVSGGADANHFHPDYFGRGVVWDHPDLENSERAYTLARDVYARDGRVILDATIDGHLTVFPKLKLAALRES